jgi:hypothetical protein
LSRHFKSTSARSRAIAALAALTIVATAAGASAAEAPLDEGVPGGPLACSVVDESATPSGRGRNLWVQCNFELHELRVSGVRVGVRALAQPQELVGARPTDSMSCVLPDEAIVCRGDLATFARVRVRLGIDSAPCRSPGMRFAVSAFGARECTGPCPAIGYSIRASSAPIGRRASCGAR